MSAGAGSPEMAGARDRAPDEGGRAVVVRAAGAADLDRIRDLCRAYRRLLLAMDEPERAMMAAFYPEAAYEALLAGLPGPHAPPEGAMLALVVAGRIEGCGMLQRLEPGVAEIKRLYVAPAARGTGGGAALCLGLVAAAREAGFRSVRLDTARRLEAAMRLYPRLGFRERGPYLAAHAGHEPLLAFFERDL